MKPARVVLGAGALFYACTSSSTGPGPGGGGGGDAGRGASGAAGRNASGGSTNGGESAGGTETSGGTTTSGGDGGADESGGVGGGTGAGRGGGASGGRGGATGGSTSGDAGISGEAGAGGEALPAPVDVPTHVSGSRLKARVWAGSDGSRHFIGFHDTGLDLDCDFVDVGSGNYRCAPTSPTGVYQYVFADDQCTLPAIGYQAGCDALSYYTAMISQSACEGVARGDIQVVGPSYPSAFQDNGGTCQAYPVVNPGTEWHAVTPADPADFVGATLERVNLGAGLSLVSFAATEGARRVLTLSFGGRPCSAAEVAASDVRCLGNLRVNPYTYFVDDACTTRLGYTFGGTLACELPEYLPFRRVETQGQCSKVFFDLVEVSPFSGTGVYRLNGDVCTAITIPPGTLRRWTIGPVVHPTLPALTTAPEGATRLRRTITRTENGSAVDLGSGIYDSVLGQTCQPERFTDDVVRCVPPTSPTDNYYSDTACTVPISPQAACVGSEFRETRLDTASVCSNAAPVQALYRIGATHVGAVYQWMDADTCLELPDPGITFSALELVPPSDLVTLTEELE